MSSSTLTRRAVFAGAVATVASTALTVTAAPLLHKPRVAYDGLSAQERVELHIAGLRQALIDLGVGPVRAVVGSDHGAILEPLNGRPFQRGVSPTLWRIA